jgi:hypothetical protein
MKQHTFANSSQVKTVRYFDAEQILEIEYVTNKTYQYFQVPESVYEGCLSAESVGKYVNSNVKGKYEYKQIPF